VARTVGVQRTVGCDHPEELVALGGVLRKEETSELLSLLSETEIVPRSLLLEELDTSESVLSKYIGKMKKVGLVDSQKSGRQKDIRILPLGRKILKLIDSKEITRFFDIVSDLNRILILKAIEKNDGRSTCKVVYQNVKQELTEHGEPEIDKDLLRYHLVRLKKEGQISNHNRVYGLTERGHRTVEILSRICKENRSNGNRS
jgi:predicted transcriptional regulator